MLSYNDCVEMFKKARAKKRGGTKRVKLEHNTYLYKSETDSSFLIYFHATAIVTIFKNNAYQLKTGGWYSVTTKARMNQFAPVRIFQSKHQWYVGQNKPFQDGMIVKAA